MDPSPKVAVPAPAMEGCEAWFNDMLRAGIVPDGFRPDEGWPDSPHFRRLRRRYEQVCAAYVVGDFPLGAEHDAAVWLLGRVARLERLNAHTEFILRSPGDRKRPTADLAIFADETSPVWLIEWKTDLSGHSQLRRAIDQVRGYGKRTGRPCRLTVAGYDAEDRSVEEVEIRTPETLLSDLRAAARTATEDLVA